MDTGLTTIPEADIEKHRATAQSMITRVVVLEVPRASRRPRSPVPAAASSRPCLSDRSARRAKSS